MQTEQKIAYVIYYSHVFPKIFFFFPNYFELRRLDIREKLILNLSECQGPRKFLRSVILCANTRRKGKTNKVTRNARESLSARRSVSSFSD